MFTYLLRSDCLSIGSNYAAIGGCLLEYAGLNVALSLTIVILVVCYVGVNISVIHTTHRRLDNWCFFCHSQVPRPMHSQWTRGKPEGVSDDYLHCHDVFVKLK